MSVRLCGTECSIAIASLVVFVNLFYLLCCILVLLVVPTLVCFSYVQVMENGIVYLVSMEGQKTGFYADRSSRPPAGTTRQPTQAPA